MTRFDGLNWVCDVQSTIFCGKGGGGTTSTSSSQPPPEVMEQYRKVIAQGNEVAQQPLELYQGQMVAPFTGMQNAAFDTINQSQGIGTPYLNQAASNLQQSTVPTWQNAQAFMSPYTQNVVDATRANMQENNAVQNQQLIGNAISKGAWGGDRAGIAQAELARQQKLADDQTISGLYNNAYTTGLGAAAQNAALNQQAAQGYAGLGQQAQNQALTGAGAQLQAGGLQQQLEQAALNVPYQQYAQQQGFPYQNLQWLSGLSTGLGGQMGGTSSTTQPGPSAGSQIFGGLLGAAGAAGALGWAPFSDRRLKKDVERIGSVEADRTKYPLYSFKYKGTDTPQVGVMAQDVEKKNPGAVIHDPSGYRRVDYTALAAGGSPFDIPQPMSFIPSPGQQMQLPPSLPPPPQMQSQEGQNDPMSAGLGLLASLKGNKSSPESYGGLSPEAQVKMDVADEDASTGAAFQDVLKKLKDPAYFSGGGSWLSRTFGLADGGLASYMDLDPTSQVAQDVLDEDGMSMPDYYDSVGNGGIMLAGPSIPQISADSIVPPPNPAQIQSQMANLPPPPAAQPANPSAQGVSPEQGGLEAFSGGDYKADPSLALLAASLGILGGESPHASVNIGKGGLAGLQNWMAQKQLEKAATEKQAYYKYLTEKMADSQKNNDIKNHLAEARLAQAETRTKLADEDRDAARDQAQAFKIQGQVTKFSNQLQTTGVPEFGEKLANVGQLLAKHEKDIPGYGPVANSLPTFLLSDEGKAIRQAVSSIKNQRLHDFSGAAVTVPEAERFEQELGEGRLRTADDIRRGYNNVVKAFEKKKQNIYAGVPQKVREQYEEQGGALLQPLPLLSLSSDKKKEESTSEVPQFSSTEDEGFKKLPSGSVFMDANGKLRHKH